MCTTHASSDGRHCVVVVKAGFEGASHYIGRAFAGERASSLANPRSLRAGWQRGETIALYEQELRAALDRDVEVASWNGRALAEWERERMRSDMNRLFSELRRSGKVVLRCFCAPLAAMET